MYLNYTIESCSVKKVNLILWLNLPQPFMQWFLPVHEYTRYIILNRHFLNIYSRQTF